MLDRAINPRSDMSVQLAVHGLFKLPEDLVKSHEAAHFQYRFKLWNTMIDFGKYCPKEFTEEELEQLKNKKKDPKKDKVEESGAVVFNDGLSEEERRLKDLEDKYKSPSVRFLGEPAPVVPGQPAPVKGQEVAVKIETVIEYKFEMVKEVKKTGEALEAMEASIQSGSAVGLLERYCTLSEDEQTKLKKKLKGPQLKELKTMVCQVHINMSELQVTEDVRIEARCSGHTPKGRGQAGGRLRI